MYTASTFGKQKLLLEKRSHNQLTALVCGFYVEMQPGSLPTFSYTEKIKEKSEFCWNIYTYYDSHTKYNVKTITFANKRCLSPTSSSLICPSWLQVKPPPVLLSHRRKVSLPTDSSFHYNSICCNYCCCC